MQILICFMFPGGPLNYPHLKKFFFLSAFSDWAISTILSSRSLILSYISSNVLLILSSVFFISVMFQLLLVLAFSNSLLKLLLFFHSSPEFNEDPHYHYFEFVYQENYLSTFNYFFSLQFAWFANLAYIFFCLIFFFDSVFVSIN